MVEDFESRIQSEGRPGRIVRAAIGMSVGGRERTVQQFEPRLFELQFDPARIAELSDAYSYPKEASVFEAGKRIASGDYSRANLEVIFEWKTKGQGRTRVAANSDDEIADALRLVLAAKTERAAVAVLCGLHGVQIPVASAILAAIDPARFTIIDFRALEALGIKNAVDIASQLRAQKPRHFNVVKSNERFAALETATRGLDLGRSV